ncbi:MAG: porin family protein [Bacteroidales bacterium]|nr:porin family protein [Bacteroidales bacterium]MCF8403456.1 porin family protein [Bacteroidales bacterium]
MKTKVIIALVTMVMLNMNSFAQENNKRFGFELNGGASKATSKLSDASLNIGYGFEGILHYRFMPHTGLYAGWGWNKFSSDDTFAGKDMDFEETGYIFGLQFKHPIGSSPVSFMLRAGGLYNHIELENTDGEIVEDSGHGFGMQFAGGIDVPLGKNWSVAPGLKFNSLNRSMDHNNESRELNLNYLSLRVGIVKKF